MKQLKIKIKELVTTNLKLLECDIRLYQALCLKYYRYDYNKGSAKLYFAKLLNKELPCISSVKRARRLLQNENKEFQIGNYWVNQTHSKDFQRQMYVSKLVNKNE